MDLIQEQDNVPVRLNLGDQALHPLLELAAVFRSRDKPREIQRIDLLILHLLRDHTGRQPLGQAFHYSRFAHSRLADQTGIVLRPAAQHLHEPVHFLLTSDDRIQFSFRRPPGHICTELIHHGVGASPVLLDFVLIFLRVDPHSRHNILKDLLQADIQGDQDPGGHAVHIPDNG